MTVEVFLIWFYTKADDFQQPVRRRFILCLLVLRFNLLLIHFYLDSIEMNEKFGKFSFLLSREEVKGLNCGSCSIIRCIGFQEGS